MRAAKQHLLCGRHLHHLNAGGGGGGGRAHAPPCQSGRRLGSRLWGTPRPSGSQLCKAGPSCQRSRGCRELFLKDRRGGREPFLGDRATALCASSSKGGLHRVRSKPPAAGREQSLHMQPPWTLDPCRRARHPRPPRAHALHPRVRVGWLP